MNNIVRSCLVLFIISSVCVTALAYVNEITLKPIQEQERLAEEQAFKELFPGAASFEADTSANLTEGGIITGVTNAVNGGDTVGRIIRVAQKGYGGTINMMVGIKPDGSISAIKVLGHSETPGLGANCESPVFTGKFAGKNEFPLVVIKSGTPKANEIDAITSATITTKAVADAVNTAYEWVKNEGGGK